MNEIVRLIDLPPTVNGLITIDNDGNYNIYINSRLSYEDQLVALSHELAHAKRDHLFCERTAQEIETELKKLSEGL